MCSEVIVVCDDGPNVFDWTVHDDASCYLPRVHGRRVYGSLFITMIGLLVGHSDANGEDNCFRHILALYLC